MTLEQRHEPLAQQHVVVGDDQSGAACRARAGDAPECPTEGR
jgi:hypothetical protein